MSDPYEILKLDRGASKEDVKRAYYYIAKIYSPENGGNAEEYLKFQNAYREIMLSLQEKYQQNGHINDARGGFSNDRFNQEFMNRLRGNTGSEEDGYVYNIDSSNYKERTKSDYNRQRARVTAEAESIAPMFKGRFNNNVFNRMFNQEKELFGKEDEHVGMPVPAEGTDIIAYSNIDKMRDTTNLSSLPYSNISVYDKYHKNPKGFNKKHMSKMARMKDITKEKKLSEGEARQRMSNYNSTSIQYNKDPLMTDCNTYINDGCGGGSQMMNVPQESRTKLSNLTVQEAMQQKMMELRQQPQMIANQARVNMNMNMGSVMSYPMNSQEQLGSNGNKELPGQMRPTALPLGMVDEPELLPQRQVLPHQMVHYSQAPQYQSAPPAPTNPSHHVPPTHAASPSLTPQQMESLRIHQMNQNQTNMLVMQQKRNYKKHKKNKMRDTIRMQQRTINRLLRNQSK